MGNDDSGNIYIGGKDYFSRYKMHCENDIGLRGAGGGELKRNPGKSIGFLLVGTDPDHFDADLKP